MKSCFPPPKSPTTHEHPECANKSHKDRAICFFTTPDNQCHRTTRDSKDAAMSCIRLSPIPDLLSLPPPQTKQNRKISSDQERALQKRRRKASMTGSVSHKQGAHFGGNCAKNRDSTELKTTKESQSGTQTKCAPQIRSPSFDMKNNGRRNAIRRTAGYF